MFPLNAVYKYSHENVYFSNGHNINWQGNLWLKESLERFLSLDLYGSLSLGTRKSSRSDRRKCNAFVTRKKSR